MARTLEVHLAGNHVGTLTQTDSGELSFQYAEAWLEGEQPSMLSASLPLRGEPFGHRQTRPYFGGLLPEAEKRDQVARAVGVTARNDFALLDRIGGECAGAVSLVPTGEPPPREPSEGDYQVLSEADLARIVRTLPDRPLMAGREGIRLSLAGAQDKLPVTLIGEQVCLALNGMPSSHILKPPIRRFDHSIENEAFSLRLARALGLQAVDPRIRQAESERFLLVPRYDRVREPSGRLRRLHQEDLCQALGIPPETKYESEGGPSWSQGFDLVRRVCARPVLDLARLLDAAITTYLLGNHDAHGKNFSILYGPHGPELAPLYDLACTVVYPELTDRMAMKLGGQYKPEDVFPRHWARFAKDAGLGPSQVKRRLRRFQERIVPAAEAVIAASPDIADATGTLDSALAAISRRCELLARE